jgi:hypothetical protein
MAPSTSVRYSPRPPSSWRVMVKLVMARTSLRINALLPLLVS